MANYDVLIFDLVGVLVEGSDVTTKAMLKATNMTDDEMWNFWINSSTVRDFDSGRISSLDFGERLVEDLKLPLEVDEFLDLFRGWIAGLYDGTEAMLGKLSSAYRLACFSNINEIMWPLIRDHHGMGGLLDEYFLSYKMGMLKPDGDAFEYVLSELEVAPERIAFFDDLEVNVRTAQQAGMHAFVTKGLPALENELQRLGIL
jgi:HAD superfamily hydrolase (TIGR01509 family)